jgi:membrane protease YdiL (CAAX protease family)
MTTEIEPNRLPVPGGPRNGPSVPAGVEYHRVLAGDERRIGRGVVAIVLLLAGLVAFPTIVGLAVARYEGSTPPVLRGTDYTPLYHAASMLSLALLAPWSMLVQRWLYGVPGASLHSVTSRFRSDLLGRSLLVLGPAWLAVVVLGSLVEPTAESPWSRTDLVLMLLAVLLLTPLQAAGEEYGVRGLLLRVVGSWTRGARAGLVAGVLVTSVLFTAVHGSTDVHIIVWYLVLWTGLALITWRTGGLEIAIVLHAVLNTATLVVAVALRVDLGVVLQDRSTGTGSPYLLVMAAAVVVITAIVWWSTRRTGPALTPAAPGARTGGTEVGVTPSGRRGGAGQRPGRGRR